MRIAPHFSGIHIFLDKNMKPVSLRLEGELNARQADKPAFEMTGPQTIRKLCNEAPLDPTELRLSQLVRSGPNNGLPSLLKKSFFFPDWRLRPLSAQADAISVAFSKADTVADYPHVAGERLTTITKGLNTVADALERGNPDSPNPKAYGGRLGLDAHQAGQILREAAARLQAEKLGQDVSPLFHQPEPGKKAFYGVRYWMADKPTAQP